MKAYREFLQLKEVDAGGFKTEGNLRIGEIISVDSDVMKSLKKGWRVLFDTHKAMQHEGYYYVKADTIFAYDENK